MACNKRIECNKYVINIYITCNEHVIYIYIACNKHVITYKYMYYML